MKKKIINGILMVALLAATTTSFVSCKDNDEDVKTDLLAQLNKQAGDLNTQWAADTTKMANALRTYADNKFATKQNLEDLKTYLKDSFATKSQLADSMLKVSDRLDSLGLQIDTIKMSIDTIKHDIDTLKNRMKAVELRLDTLETDIDNILTTLTKMVTSVTVNATSNSILSNSKVFPGLNIQFVGAAYGDPINAKGSFPSKDSDKENELSEAAFDGVKSLPGYYEWDTDKDTLLINEKNKDEFSAGKIFFTINPSNVNPKDLKSLTLVNSLQKEYFTIDMGSIEECKEELTWGVTRAEEHKANLWEANVTYNAKTVKAIDPKNVINFSAIKDNIKTIIAEAKNTNRSNAKENTKAIIKETAQVVANLLNAKLPAMPAVALKATWQDTVGVRSVLSDYSIAATAYKPLSFDALHADNKDYINLTKLDNAFAKFVDEIMTKLNKVNTTVSKFSKVTIDMQGLDPQKFNIDQSVYITIGLDKKTMTFDTYDEFGNKTTKTETINVITKISFQNDKPEGIDLDNNPGIDLSTAAAGTYFTYISIKKDLADQIKIIQDAINKGIDLSELTGAVSDLVADANNYANRAKDLEKRVTDYLESFLNKSINFIATGKVLEPILLVDTKDGIHRAAGSYEAGKFTFVPTTMNFELIAPAFKKYIAVLDKNGNVIKGSQKILTKGDKNFGSVEVELTKDAAQIVYAAMDFQGYQEAKVYNVYVK